MPYTTEQWHQQGAWFIHRGHRIFYVTKGSGPALLLLHGFPTSSWDWHKIWDTLTVSYRVIAPDFIGFGFSDKPAGYDYSMLDRADLVEDLLKQLAIAEYHILSHDIGDTVTQELLARQSDRNSGNIKSCCLLNGGLFPETHRPTGTQKLLLSPLGFLVGRLMSFQKFRKAFSILFGPRSKPAEEELRSFYDLIEFNKGTMIMHLLIKYILERRRHRERWVAALQKFNRPLMLIDGTDDPVSGAHMVKRYRELIATPNIIELPGIGHYPHTEAAAGVLEAYTDFRLRNSSAS